MEQDCLIYLEMIAKWKTTQTRRRCAKISGTTLMGNYDWMYDYHNCIGNNICSQNLLIKEWLFNGWMNIVTMLSNFSKEKKISTFHYVWGPTYDRSLGDGRLTTNKRREEQEKRLLAPIL